MNDVKDLKDMRGPKLQVYWEDEWIILESSWKRTRNARKYALGRSEDEVRQISGKNSLD